MWWYLYLAIVVILTLLHTQEKMDHWRYKRWQRKQELKKHHHKEHGEHSVAEELIKMGMKGG